MTTDNDQLLRDAFASRPDQNQAGVGAKSVDADRIWLAVSGQLPAEERRQIVSQLATDPEAARAWQLAHELFEAEQEQSRVKAPVRSIDRGNARPTASTSFRPWLAAAAMLLASLIGLAWWMSQRGPSSNGEAPVLRAPVGPAIVSLVADGAALTREAAILRWRVDGLPGTPADPSTGELRYDLKVLTRDGAEVVTIRDLQTPEYTLTAEVLDQLPPATELLWQVDARLPDGERLRSHTFFVALR